jgi:hypothetical protein
VTVVFDAASIMPLHIDRDVKVNFNLKVEHIEARGQFRLTIISKTLTTFEPQARLDSLLHRHLS